MILFWMGFRVSKVSESNPFILYDSRQVRISKMMLLK